MHLLIYVKKNAQKKPCMLLLPAAACAPLLLIYNVFS